MTIDYEQLKLFVKEAMFTGGGINEPSAPEGIPHRMPAADPSRDEGDAKANELYDLSLVAREAIEAVVEALDEPIYDSPYEHAFKASACFRKVLNDLEGLGASPAPEDRVVAPPSYEQPYNATRNRDQGASGAGAAIAGLEESALKAPADNERLTKIRSKAPGLEKAADMINNQVEFETELANFLAQYSNVTDAIKKTAIQKLLTTLNQKAI